MMNYFPCQLRTRPEVQTGRPLRSPPKTSWPEFQPPAPPITSHNTNMSNNNSKLETDLQRSELIEEIQQTLNDTPRPELEAAFEPAVILIQSKSRTDNRYPPEEGRITSNNQRFLTIWPFRYAEKSRAPGNYYYAWDAVTTHPGLFMDARGEFYEAHLSGSGEFAAFPARPGNTNVTIEVAYRPTDYTLEDLNDDDLQGLSEALSEALA